MTEMPTKWQLAIYKIKSMLCKECKYSSYYGLMMCKKHSSKDWAKYEAMHPEFKTNYDKYHKERLRNSMGSVMLEQTKSGKGFVRPEHFKLFPFLTFSDKLKLRFYRRKHK